MQNLRVAALQFQHQTGAVSNNLEILHRWVRGAAEQDVRLVVAPECCLSGYWGLRHWDRDRLETVAEAVPHGSSCQQLLAWADAYQCSIGAGLIERDGDRLYNAYVVAMPGGRWACHRKLHCFVNPHLASGDQYTVFQLPDGTRAAILICYDNNLIENPRACALLGAEVLIAPHQTGGCRSASPHGMKPIDVTWWEERATNPERLAAEFRGDKGRGWLLRWLPSRAHDNGLFVIFSNGVGRDDDEVRTGNAMILDPYGRILAESTALGDDLVVATLDASLRDRCTGARWLRARRPELYDVLQRMTGQERPIREVRFEGLDPAQVSRDSQADA